jgi:hypothetical protein
VHVRKHETPFLHGCASLLLEEAKRPTCIIFSTAKYQADLIDHPAKGSAAHGATDIAK